MGLYDSSDRFLKRALHVRQQIQDEREEEKGQSNMKIVVPIIKLKSEQFKSETMNLSFQDKEQKLLKIIGVLDSKMKD